MTVVARYLSASEHAQHRKSIGCGLAYSPQAEPSTNLGCWLLDFYAQTELLPADFLMQRQDANMDASHE